MFNPTVHTIVTFDPRVPRSQANLAQSAIWVEQGVTDGEIYPEYISETVAKSNRYWTTRQAAEEYIQFSINDYPPNLPPLTYQIIDL